MEVSVRTEASWLMTHAQTSDDAMAGGMLFHVLNRGVGRMRMFLKEAYFEAFERIISQTLETRPMRILYGKA